MLQPFDFGRKHVWRNSLLHFSRWLVGVFHRDEQNVFEVSYNITFDNIAVIHYLTSSENQQHNQTVITCNIDEHDNFYFYSFYLLRFKLSNCHTLHVITIITLWTCLSNQIKNKSLKISD